jgi:transposase
VQGYNLTLIAAMTIQNVISMQVVEGGTDAVIFENFLFRTLESIRRSPTTRNKPIVILMDNAVIHKTPVVYNTAKRMNATLLLNAEYSPWLNPIEQLFNRLKR